MEAQPADQAAMARMTSKACCRTGRNILSPDPSRNQENRVPASRVVGADRLPLGLEGPGQGRAIEGQDILPVPTLRPLGPVEASRDDPAAVHDRELVVEQSP